MNPTTTTQLTPPPPPPPPHAPPHAPLTSCHKHPLQYFTSFCPLCLCDRLSFLHPNNNNNKNASSSRKPPTSSTAAAAVKTIFRPHAARYNKPISSSFLPELRRAQSFSASKNEGFSSVLEPQRKSCDVRGRSTLCSLFNQDDERKISKNNVASSSSVEFETRNLASSSSTPFNESKEDEESYEDNVVLEIEEEEDENSEVIRASEEPNNVAFISSDVIENTVHEIVEKEPVFNSEENFSKPLKEQMDLDSQAKKGSVSSFWSAASVFSKKLQKWRQKQKMKKQRNGIVVGSTTLPVEKSLGRQFRETQSEIADYGFGRRSCDTDPRFSLDAGRMSFEDLRYSFDEPRASWDGYLIGRGFSGMPTMLSVVEDAPVLPQVMRTDSLIPVVEPMMNAINENEDDNLPGGSAQTREYYSDSSSKSRKSLDRSSSIRKTAAAVVAEMDEFKPVSSSIGSSNVNVNNVKANAKVTPATGDYFHGQKMVFPDRDLRDTNSNSLRDDCSETFELGFRDSASVIGNGVGEKKGLSKKWSRWSKAWNIWGLINRRGGGNKDEDEENRYNSRGNGNGVERSFSESWQEYRRERNGDAIRNGSFNPKLLRSNSSVSWRNVQNIGGSFGTMRKSNVQTNVYGRKGRDNFVLERNQSARYSPNHFDNGLLRLYMNPMQVIRGSRRNGSTKGRTNQAPSIARSALRLY
ncbi:hypothetical protein TanjilG_10363 [Lupinus angustifolius]|uniref:Uncharacterized protein n=1 Tax=Lupinus angustifolius TaxID=3871 RepID=A0A4P1R4W9_LUPAN|nr:PREDICTED: UPF0503 protein At3g09070, chloroplastic-like [Lupinus angustifolius]OIW01202.1 hypothetical protein TanjilG_10363 [Lupinus angustifolius]